MTAEQPRQVFTGWGRTSPSLAQLRRPASPAQVAQLLTAAGPRGVAPRGLGRAYGDAAGNAGGLVADLTGLNSIDEVTHGSVTVGAGVTLDSLLRRVVPQGWFVPVTPGTRYVTVGGAIAADIHGKNHHVDGTFCQHLEWLEMVTPDGGTRRLSPDTDSDAELFWATAGGMGLTGVVTAARLRLLPVQTARLRVRTQRLGDLDALMAEMRDDEAYRYSVAWIDCLARGRSLGRGVLTRGDHATFGELSVPEQRAALRYQPRQHLSAPRWMPPGLLNRASVAAFNEVWFRRAARDRTALESIPAFFHPLDGVAAWNRMYGRTGFLQYQFVVGESATETIRRGVELVSGAGAPSFLAVLKRFGAANRGPLSFPMAGWTLALDIPLGLSSLPRLCRQLDDLVLAAGGRVYLAKDSRLPAPLLAAMYPRLSEWQATRRAVDPTRRCQTDLGRRLHL